MAAFRVSKKTILKLGIIGTVVLLVAYWVAIEHFMAGGGVMLLVAVLLGIVGTLLFIRGIAWLLSIVEYLLAKNVGSSRQLCYTELYYDPSIGKKVPNYAL